MFLRRDKEQASDDRGRDNAPVLATGGRHHGNRFQISEAGQCFSAGIGCSVSGFAFGVWIA